MRWRSFLLGAVLGAVVTLGLINIYALVRARQMWLQQQGGLKEALAALALRKPAYRRLPSPLFSTAIGRSPEGWALRSLDGKRVQLSDFKGRVVFLSFWATWCEPCLEEMPSIEKLQESLQGKPVSFLLVTDEDPEKVRAFVAQQQFTLPVYLREPELPEIFQPRLGDPKSYAVPAAYILDKSGRVVFYHLSAANWDTDDARRFLISLSEQ